MSMFCYQCQETAKNQGCTIKGVCGKSEEVANLQDVLIFVVKGISFWSNKARSVGKKDTEADLFVIEALFSTITNANFDPEDMVNFINKAVQLRDKVKSVFLNAYKEKNGSDFSGDIPQAASWVPSDGKAEYLDKAPSVGVLSQENEDIRSLRELLTYGIKGISAYADHAYVLNEKSEDIFSFIHEGLAATTDDSLEIGDLLGLVLKCGEYGVNVMALLDKANTETFGVPEITQVFTGTLKGPGILVSGHDLLDLEELLKQTEGKGINVYTHGEMLPAHGYPELKKYKHLAGNYGSSWWKQQEEFADFNGPILMTTNCIQQPKDSYKGRIYTTGVVGWPGLVHIPNRTDGKPKDFSALIEQALALGDVGEKTGKHITVGLAHETVLSLADTVVKAVKDGAVKRFFVMAGCDGRHASRSYHTELAQKLPEDTIILTAGCAKYRYNMLDLGDIGGIPRLIDAGQCNDSYSLAVVALKLKEVFGLDDINDLPISFNVAWYEQKAVTVLLALLYLGVKNIRLCPTIPAFLSPNVVKVLVDKFDLKPITTVNADLEAMLAGK